MRSPATFQQIVAQIPHFETRRGFEVGPTLGDLTIEKANHVWCTDITYIPAYGGFFYLVAIMDWATRKVLSWRFSNTMAADFCVEALKEAIELYGAPQIFNSDQGSQFTSHEFAKVLLDAGVKISMDGKVRCMDKIFIERLWRSLKYECTYLHEICSGFEAKKLIGEWMGFYNDERPHSSFDRTTPAVAYEKRDKALSPHPPNRPNGLAGGEVTRLGPDANTYLPMAT